MSIEQQRVRFNYSNGKQGGTKKVGRLVPSKLGEPGILFDKKITDYLVFKYILEDNYDSVRIYGELKKYQELSEKNYAPAIVHCYSYKESITMSFEKFMSIYDTKPEQIPNDTNYIIEKLNCDEDLFTIFKINSFWSYFYVNRDYITLFSKLKDLLTVLATPSKDIPGLFLVDMKSGNICSDNVGNLKLIDFDPARLYSILNQEYVKPAITFMLFQTYLIFYLVNKDITFDVTGISEDEYDEMINFIYNIEKSEEGDELFYLKGNPTIRETISPFRSLLSYYFQIQRIPEYDRIRKYNEVLSDKDFYNEIAGMQRRRDSSNSIGSKTGSNTKKIERTSINNNEHYNTVGIKRNLDSSIDNPNQNTITKTDSKTGSNTDSNTLRKKIKAGKGTKKGKKAKKTKRVKKE
jgi:hypothetical protein